MTRPPVLSLPERVLMGPGPSGVPASVLAAMSRPTIGHLDPEFLRVMDEVRDMLRSVFGTQNLCTLPMSGTGSAGMETCIVNLIEPGDRLLIGMNGVFGTRLAEVARRAGADVTAVPCTWGRAVDADQLRQAAGGKSYKVVCVVHAETSTGVLQPLPPIKALADELGALLLVDCVTSLGGLPVELDRHGVDAAYSGTQKCLSCPPGLSPVSFSARAQASFSSRKSKVQSWYLDLNLIAQYWGQERAYHHTAPINSIYALHEALRLVELEGLPARAERHRKNARALAAGLSALGLELGVPEAERLAPLTLVRVPSSVDEAKVRQFLLSEHGLEIGGGLGDFKGKAWRIGLMGHGSTPRNVMFCLAALADALAAQGVKASSAGAIEAARASYAA
jgi:alanine-glyoxylate transaminase / serine-glyoxylate transaminase / serine-pyruvate transaminase